MSNAPEVTNTEMIRASVAAVVQQSGFHEMETSINTELVQSDAILRNFSLGRIEFTLKELQVTNPQELKTANQYLVDLKDCRKKFEEYWDRPLSLKRIAHGLHKLFSGTQSAGLKRLDEAIKSVEKLIIDYDRQTTKQAEQQQAHIADATEILRKQMIDEAKVLSLEGKPKEAQRLREQAKTLVTPIVPAPALQLEGLSVRENKWIVTVEDSAAFLKAMVAGDVPNGAAAIEKWNTAWLAQRAAAMNSTEDQFELYPGVIAVRDVSLARNRRSA